MNLTGWNPSKVFGRFAAAAAAAAGHWAGFAAAFLVVVGWTILGPVLGFSETWMLIINTVTTIVTFLLVFIIQHTQTRNEQAIQKKLDELIVSLEGPDDAVAGIEEEA